MKVCRIVTIDRQAGSDTTAVWITTRTSAVEVGHTNAVEFNAGDPAMSKIAHSLTRDCGILITDGTVLDGLPVEGEPLTRADIDALVNATEEHQTAILTAVEDYRRSTRSKTLVLPDFPSSPSAADFKPTEDTASQRALATANYLAMAWNRWLQTDEERRRRTARPKTGETPWIMPDHLNDPKLAAFPAAFAARIHEQPLV